MDNRYSKYYSEKSLWKKVKNFSKDAGVKVVYTVLLLFFAMKGKNVSVKTKLLIAASLGYFILPADAIFDLTPVIGYSDDLGVLLFALNQVSSAITIEVTEKAREKISQWFSTLEWSEIADVEEKINS